MTKKVISIIFLIVTSLIFATAVFAEYVGLPTTNFDIVFKKVVDNTHTIAVLDSSNSNIINKTLDRFHTNYTLNDPQCKIVVGANHEFKIRVVFNLFHNTTDSSIKDTISYKVNLYYSSNSVKNYEKLEVSADNTGAEDKFYFTTGNNKGVWTEYTYLLAFSFQEGFDEVAPGDYEAEIRIEVQSNE